MLPKKITNILNNKENRELLVSAGFAFAIRIVGAISGFAATFFIARALGAAESGYYFLAFTLVTVLAAVARVGLDKTVLRFTSGSPEYAVDVIKKAILLIVAISLPSVLISYYSAEFISVTVFSKPALAPVIQKMAIGILGLSALTITAMALQGLRKVSASIFVLNIAVNLILIVFLYFWGVKTAVSLASLYSIGAVVIALIGSILFYIYRPRVASSTISWKILFASCLPLWVVVIMSQMVQWSGQFVAGVYVSSELVAQLAVAQRTAMLSSFVLIAVNLVVAPRFAALYRQGELAKLESLAIKSVKLVGLFALPVIGVMLVFPSFLMGLFGDGFTSGAHLLQILAIGQFINAMTGSVGFLLIMSGHERDMRNVTLISGSAAMLLTWVLTMHFGITGAAVATAIAVATQNLLAVYFVKKRLGFNTLAVWR